MKTIRALLASALLVAARTAPALCGAAPDDLERSVALMAKNRQRQLAVVLAGRQARWPSSPTSAGCRRSGRSTPPADTRSSSPHSTIPSGSSSGRPTGEWLAFTLAPGGGMNEQVYLVRPDGTGLKRLTDGGKETNRLGPWADDGAMLAMGSNRGSGAAIDAYVYDVAAGTSKLAAREPRHRRVSKISLATGSARLLNRLVNRGDNNLYLVELASGQRDAADAAQGPGSFSGEFARDGRAVYLETNDDRDQIAFARMELGAERNRQPGKVTLLAQRPDAELGSFELDDAGTTAAILWNVAGRSELELMDLKTGKTTRTPEAAGGDRRAGSTSRTTASRSRWSSPAPRPRPTSGSWTFATGAFRQVTHSPHAGRGPREAGPARACQVPGARRASRCPAGSIVPLGPGAVSDGAVVSRRARRPGATGFQQHLPGAAVARHRRLRAERARLLRLRQESS